MTHAVDAALIVETVTPFLYILLGAWILTLKPRRLQTTLLGGFAILFGLEFAVTDGAQIVHWLEFPGLAHAVVETPFVFLAHGFALALAWAVPKPLEDRRLLWIALAVGLGLGLVNAGSFLAVGQVAGVAFSETQTWVWAVFFLGFGILWSAVVLLALRARPSRGLGRPEVTQLALLAVALGMLNAFTNGLGVPFGARALAQGDLAEMVWRVSFTLPWFVIAGLWGSNMLQADERTSRIHRTAMVGILGLVTAGALYFALVPGANPGFNIMRGALRTLGVGLLAYGILRHDIAGLDAKVEFGVSKTTVAGIFVAVFFAASEAAQILFADFAGNELIGVAAAALLVFAISPLQRLADRFAAKAVPGGGAAGSDDAETYRVALRKFLADGELTHKEERHLARLADRLGIATERTLEIRKQVEDELTSEGGR